MIDWIDSVIVRVQSNVKGESTQAAIRSPHVALKLTVCS